MQWLEMNNVEYGDCIVMGGKNLSIFMVDCGSINQKLRSPEMDISDVFSFIRDRYSGMSEKHFLLSHYHRDHLCGLKNILKTNPLYFDRVYIPYLPRDTLGNSPLLDFAIFANIFLPPQTDCSQVNTSCLNMFKHLTTTVGADRIFTLKAGDIFNFDNVEYEILSPNAEDFLFGDIFLSAVDKLNISLSNPFLKGCEAEFLRLKNEFITAYYRCLDAFSAKNRKSPEKRLQYLDHLELATNRLESLKADISHCLASVDIIEIINSFAVREAYSEASNAASIIFHNIRQTEASTDDILMTGDATSEIIQHIYDKLYNGYFVVKAPHHGTASGYSSVFKDIGIGHLLISSGDYHAAGDIASEYTDLETIKHCTNTTKCKWFNTSSGCCNRLNYCYDQDTGVGLTIKCSATKFLKEKPACEIYVVAPTGGRSCFCDISVITGSVIN